MLRDIAREDSAEVVLDTVFFRSEHADGACDKNIRCYYYSVENVASVVVLGSLSLSVVF